MEKSPTPSPTPKKGGIPLWTALIALVVLIALAAAGLGAILYFTRSDKEKLKRQIAAMEAKQAQSQLDEKKAADDAARALAKTRQEELLAQARNATNVLTRLLQGVNGAAADAAVIKTNAVGRTIALSPDLVAQARRLYEANLPALALPAEIISRLEGARRLEQQILDAAGTTHQPAADVVVTVQNAVLWGEQELRKVADVQTLIAALVRESKVKVNSATLTDQSPTLEAAINLLNQAESAQRQKAILDATKDAKGVAADTLAKAEADRILKEAQIQASNLLAQANEAKAKFEREQALRQSTNKFEDARTLVKTKEIENEALKIQLRQKASNPEIQTKLAPFITPGYWQPSTGPLDKQPPTYDKKPHSLTRLETLGALDPSSQGLRRLGDLGMSPTDRIRPRWKMPASWMKMPQHMEKVKEVQQLLIELGPVLVEMNLLEP